MLSSQGKRADALEPIPCNATCQCNSRRACSSAPCGELAVTVVSNLKGEALYMCAACADRDIHTGRGTLMRVKKDWAGVAYGIDEKSYKVDQ